MFPVLVIIQLKHTQAISSNNKTSKETGTIMIWGKCDREIVFLNRPISKMATRMSDCPQLELS